MRIRRARRDSWPARAARARPPAFRWERLRRGAAPAHTARRPAGAPPIPRPAPPRRSRNARPPPDHRPAQRETPMPPNCSGQRAVRPARTGRGHAKPCADNHRCDPTSRAGPAHGETPPPPPRRPAPRHPGTRPTPREPRDTAAAPTPPRRAVRTPPPPARPHALPRTTAPAAPTPPQTHCAATPPGPTQPPRRPTPRSRKTGSRRSAGAAGQR